MRGKSIMPALALAVASAAGAQPTSRVYGHDNIKRHLQKWGRSRQQGNSPASYDHEHAREKARHLRQAARDRKNQQHRWFCANGNKPTGEHVEVPGRLSRRGRVMP